MPEPQTMALMLVGIGAVAWGARWRAWARPAASVKTPPRRAFSQWAPWR
ncbi:PEP-CTERM sorting domain-containing protein [Eleftheria terrae]